MNAQGGPSRNADGPIDPPHLRRRRKRRSDQSRKFSNCSGMPRSAALSACITVCRSSRFFQLTRTCSPWVWEEMPFGAFSLISLLISRAFSDEMPTLIVTTWRTVFCVASSTSP